LSAKSITIQYSHNKIPVSGLELMYDQV